MALTEVNFGEIQNSSFVDRVVDLARTGVARLGSFAILVAKGATMLNAESDLQGSDPLDSVPEYMGVRVPNIYE